MPLAQPGAHLALGQLRRVRSGLDRLGGDLARRAGLDSAPAEDLDDAMLQVTAWTRLDAQETPPRILICGSLYLAGKVLAENS